MRATIKTRGPCRQEHVPLPGGGFVFREEWDGE